MLFSLGLAMLQRIGVEYTGLGDPEVLLIIAAAAIYGVFIGAVPGLTATMAVALIVPLTFFLDPIPAYPTTYVK